MMPFKKPSADGAEVLSAGEVRRALLAGTRFRLVEVTGHPEVKVKPVGGRWPLIVESGDIDPHDLNAVHQRLVNITTEGPGRYQRVWEFVPDVLLTVITSP